MKNLIVVTSRELAEKKMIFLGSLLLGIAVLATPLLPGVSGDSHEITAVVSFYLSLVVALGGAFAAGVSFIGRDLAEDRIGFYFCRPLSSFSIWGGKILAALLLAITCAILVQIPAIVTGRSILTMGIEKIWIAWNIEAPGLAAATTPLVVLLVIALGHHFGVVFRSRSPWIAIDMVAVPAIALLFWFALAPFVESFAGGVVTISIVYSVCAVLVGLIISGAVGVARGRINLQRIHRETSIVFAVILATLTAIYAGWASWVRSMDIRDLDNLWVVANEPFADTRWIAFEGLARGRFDYVPTFLVDSETGRSIRVGQRLGSVAFSADGRRAVWPKPHAKDPGRVTLSYLELDGDDSIHDTTINASWHIAISEDGTVVAGRSGGVISAHELATGKSLLSIKLPALDEAQYVQLAFVSDDVLRVYTRTKAIPGEKAGPSPSMVNASEISLASKTVRTLGQLPDTRVVWPMFGRDRLIGVKLHPIRFSIFEASTMRPITDFDAVSLAPLDADQWLVARIEDGHARLSIRTEDGGEVRSFDLGPAASAMVGARLPDGSVLITLGERESDEDQDRVGWGNRSTVAVDLETGKTTSVGKRLYPVGGWFFLNTKGGNLFVDASGPTTKLVLRDPASGKLKVVAGHE